MLKKTILYPCLLVFYLLVLFTVSASAADIEKDLNKELNESRKSVSSALQKLSSGLSPASEISRIKSSAENIRAILLLLNERFNKRRAETATLGGEAAKRHDAVEEPVIKAIGDYLSLLDSLPVDGSASVSEVNRLKELIDTIAPKRKRPLLGALPYKHLNYPAREPAGAPVVLPAYKGGDRVVKPADTASSAEAPISKEIAELAKSLNWNPVLIYEWVKNNVETEWYWGVMKGAEETLRQKSGNDADHAALLTALLRASGFPTRYVRGTIEFFPDIEKVKSLTGINDPLKIAAFFQKAGIPFKPVMAGGAIVNFQIEHIWVESEIPYSNYRGAVVDDYGKTWLGLDTSLKPQGLAWNNPLNMPDSFFGPFRDDYLKSVQANTPLEFVKKRQRNI